MCQSTMSKTAKQALQKWLCLHAQLSALKNATKRCLPILPLSLAQFLSEKVSLFKKK